MDTTQLAAGEARTRNPSILSQALYHLATVLSFCRLLLVLCKQFGPKLVGPNMDPKHLTLIKYMKDYFLSWFWIKSADDNKSTKITKDAKS